MAGGVGDLITLSSVSLRVSRPNVCNFINPGKSNGDLVFGAVLNFLGPSSKRIFIRKGGLQGSVLFTRSAKCSVIRCTTLTSGANERGLRLVSVLTSRGRSLSGLLGCIKLSPGGREACGRCSLKVGRHLLLTVTVLSSPDLLVFSRPAGTLSRSNRRFLGQLILRREGHNGALLVSDRSGAFVASITSGVCCIDRNEVGGRTIGYSRGVSRWELYQRQAHLIDFNFNESLIHST